jgi:CubicO group peptidase (beta-lactamase class C family)
MAHRLAAASIVFATSALAAQQPADSSRTAVDRVFQRWHAKDGPGCAVGVSRDGKTIFQAGYGAAILEADVPITPASIFHVASISKQFTAMSILLLARDGKLSLDDDIRKYLPEIPDYGSPITIRHLLTHTSGLRDQWDLLALARGRFEEDRITEADVLDIVSRQKALNFPPGTEYLYSNTGYTLAGTIVRRVSGKSLRAFADERIFKPLGMMSSHFHDDYTMVVKGRTFAYSPGPKGEWHFSIPNFDTYGATSLYTTVGDLLRWQENFRRPVVGDDALLRTMQTSADLTNSDTTGKALGVTIGTDRGARVIGHGGADAGYRSYTARYPDQGLAIAVACNAAPSDPGSLAAGVAKVFLGRALVDPPVPVAAATKPSTEALARLAGLYVNQTTGAVTFVSVKDGNLIVGRTTGPTLVPLGENRFWFGPQRTEWEFPANGERMVQRFTGSPPRHAVTLVRREAAHPSAADLARYAGTYYSDELRATYIVAATDSTLTMRTGTNDPQTVRPGYGDVFLGFPTTEFVRDQSGAVTGMLVSTGRVRKVRFDRAR